MVRAKFKVGSVEKSMGFVYDEKTQKNVPSEVCTVKLTPVTSDKEEKKTFWDTTPSGSIVINCANLDDVNIFKLEKEYYVDFTLAE